MSPAEPVYLIGFGASTPVGRDALASAAAVRAGISGFTEHPYMIDTAGEPMRAAIAPWLDIDLQGAERFEALLHPAIDQALEAIGRPTGPRVALAVGLPSPRPGLPPDLGKTLRAGIAARYPNRFVAIAVLEQGHAAALLGLDAALKRFASRTFDACIIAGVDSYLAPETLEWLEENDQLHSAGPLNNAWGFVPGEAAGAVSLMTARATSETGSSPLGRLMSVGTGFEPNRIKTPTVCVGEGLTSAFREALAILPAATVVTDVYCDMNGEPYRADEFGFATLRTRECFESASDFVAPADCWGDVSAASAPLAAMLASVAGSKGYSKGRYAFLSASSEGGERAAALMTVAID